MILLSRREFLGGLGAAFVLPMLDYSRVAPAAGLGATVDDLAQAIGRFEGVNVPGSLAQRNNNPGNIRCGTGYCVYPDMVTGYAALDHQIELNVSRGLTLDQFFGGLPGVYPGYAPAADSNDPGHYSQTVAGWLGIDPNVPLTQALDGKSADSSISAITGDLSLSPDSPLSLDLFDTTGLSWPLLAGVAGGIFLLFGLIRD